MPESPRIKHMEKLKFIVIVLLQFSCIFGHENDYYSAYEAGNDNALNVGQVVSGAQYLIYDVNPGEGFNLRRDVYLRAANLVKILNEKSNWTLVVPPWRRLYHWRTHDIAQNAVPWKTFFDLKSLNRYIPVVEFEDFINATGSPGIDQTIYLQRYKEGWTNGEWEEKIDERECLDTPIYRKVEDGKYRGFFWGLDQVFTRDFKCMSVQGLATILKGLLLKTSASQLVELRTAYTLHRFGLLSMIHESVFVDRFEEVLHIEYGQSEYWKARRSLVFAKHLRKIGDKFRQDVLDSEDEKDSTVMKKDWRKNKKKEGSAVGGPYLAVHLRRADFLYAREEFVPTLDGAVKQIKAIMKRQNLDTVFLSTDASKDEIEYLKERLPLVSYEPTRSVLKQYGDGGVAIIDQWICAHARYFVGTKESTFSFRIQEERDILGFNADTTFNCLCSDKEIGKCEQPTRWRIVY